MPKVTFEELLEAIDYLPEEQKQIIRGRLNVKEADDTLEASGVIGQPTKRTSDLSETSENRLREYRLKLYSRARKYWQSVGDSARLALTDTDLDEQFWLFDGEGIPRLREDEGKIEVPETSMMRFLKLAEEADFHFEHSFDAADADEILRTEFADYLWERKLGNHGDETNSGG